MGRLPTEQLVPSASEGRKTSILLHARLRRTPEGMEGRAEERRVVRAHGKKRKGKEPDVTV
jgi:hypothetical protein